MKDFRKLNVWLESMELVKAVYTATKGFPESKKFGLISQIKRSAISIPSNIAEGCGRGSQVELKRFLEISLGSSFELETQLILSNNLELLNSTESDELLKALSQIQKKINSLINKIINDSQLKAKGQ